MQQCDKFEQFKSYHISGSPLIVGNPWDAGSALLMAELGYKALATTSAGYAFSVGKRDSFAGLSRTDILANAHAIVSATDLPVTADLEDGFGAAPNACAQTVSMAVEIGLIGGSIEDATGDSNDPIYPVEASVDRIVAAADAAKGKPFLLTARAENYLWGHDDLKDTILRLQAFSQAGADVLYAPGLPNIEAIRTLCKEVDRPVNVVMGLSGPAYSVSQLSDAGVARISVGGSFARAALGALRRAAHEVLTHGTFKYAADAISDIELAQMMSQAKDAARS